MSCGNKVLGGSPHIRRGADRLSALRTRPLCPLNSRYTTVFVKPGEQRTRAARENPSQGVDGGREANHRKRAGTNWFIAPGTFRFASSFFSTPSLDTHRFTAYLFEHKKTTRPHVFTSSRSVYTYLTRPFTMISEIERGFNYTLTRDKLAMNLGSPPRKTKNVATPAPAPTSSATSSSTTTNTYPPAPSTTPQAPSSYPPRHDSRPSSDIRVASLEQQVAHLTQKGVEAGESFGCYPCLCSSSLCMCICTSPPPLHLSFSSPLPSPFANQDFPPRSRPTRQLRRRNPQSQNPSEPTRRLTLGHRRTYTTTCAEFEQKLLHHQRQIQFPHANILSHHRLQTPPKDFCCFEILTNGTLTFQRRSHGSPTSPRQRNKSPCGRGEEIP